MSFYTKYLLTSGKAGVDNKSFKRFFFKSFFLEVGIWYMVAGKTAVYQY